MADVFLVDDDADFIENMRYLPIDGVTLHLFSNVMSAIESVSKLRPSIIVSDVQMTGVHGLDFCTIARELIKPRHFVFISGNARDVIEKKFGVLGDTPFFKKPLDDDFFAFLSRLAEESDATPQASLSIDDFHKKERDLEKAFASWKKIQEHKFEGLVEAKLGLFRSEKYSDTLRELEKECDVVCTALDLTDAGKTRMLAQFEERPESYTQRISDHILRHVKEESITLEAQMAFDFRFSGGELLRLKSCGIRVCGAEVRLHIDGSEVVELPLTSFSDGRDASAALRSIAHLGFFLLLKGRCEEQLSDPARRLFFGAQSLQQSIDGTAPSARIRIPGLKVGNEFIDELRVEFNSRMNLAPIASTPSGLFATPFSDLPQDLPSAFSIEASRRVDVKRKSTFDLECTVDGSPLSIPLDAIVADEVERGFEASENAYFRLQASVLFLWEVALGKRIWKLGRTTVSLDDCLRGQWTAI